MAPEQKVTLETMSLITKALAPQFKLLETNLKNLNCKMDRQYNEITTQLVTVRSRRDRDIKIARISAVVGVFMMSFIFIEESRAAILKFMGSFLGIN